MSDTFIDQTVGPFLFGLLLGGALWQLVIGIALIRRGHFTPYAWSGRHLATRPRTQGWGFIALAAMFALAGAGYTVTPVLGAAILAAGLGIALLVNKRLERRARLIDLEHL